MHATISSRLSAPFRPDGSHFQRFRQAQTTKRKALVEDLLLHDRVYIPTPDFYTALGLIDLLGEAHFCELMERKRLRFIRMRKNIGYIRGTGRDGGLVVLTTPNKTIASDMELPMAILAAIREAPFRIDDPDHLAHTIEAHTICRESDELLHQVHMGSITDFRNSPLWREQYLHSNPTLLNLPGVKQMSVRVLSPTSYEQKTHAVDTLLAITRSNIDCALAKEFECCSVSTDAPVIDLLNLKQRRLLSKTDGFYSLCEINDSPDLSQLNLKDSRVFEQIENLANADRAASFRKWFHSLASTDAVEVRKEFVALLKSQKWTSSLQGSFLKFLVFEIVGTILPQPLRTAITAFDSVFSQWLSDGKSPKFFFDDLSKLSGTMVPKH